MTTEEKARAAFREWYRGRPARHGGKIPAKGTIGGALVVLDRLQREFDLSIDSHTAPGGSQVSGASGTAVKAILDRFGECRPFLQEGGRTNRGLRGDIKALLDAISAVGLNKLRKSERNQILAEFQRFLVERVGEYHDLQRLSVAFDPSVSTWQCICDLLNAAKESGKEGAVAQYLVGAKLQLRFPDLEISNESFSTADTQLGRHGDFFVGNTVFHVTVSPTSALYEKCARNLTDGFRVYMLVRDKDLAGTKQNSENTATGRITVQSIEAFVGQNLDELAMFSREDAAREFRALLMIYNRRVDSTDNNKSLMIEIPQNLR